jgi:hypothetical protein
MSSAKIWILITGVVIIVSGFLVYSIGRSKSAEKAVFIAKAQELTGQLNERTAEIDRVKADLDQARKDKADFEAKYQSEIAVLEKTAMTYKAKIDALSKEKDSLTKYMENNNAIITKLNKKIETLQKERNEMVKANSRNAADDAPPRFMDLMNETPSVSVESEKPLPGTKLVNDEIVDLGRIIVHQATNETARVEHVNTLYGFIVMSAGTNDGLQQDSVVNITRNNRLIAKAVIKKIRDNVASAVTLPEWTREEIKVGDMISVNTPSGLTKS